MKKTPWMTRQKQIDEDLFALAVLDRAAHEADNERRYFDYDMALHNVRLIPDVVTAASATGYREYSRLGPSDPERVLGCPAAPSHGVKLGTRPRLSSPARKSPASERDCGGITCAPGLNGRCTACCDEK